MQVIIHMGLHKTGTKYFQNYVFPKLNVVYNPPILTQYAVDFLRADEVDKQIVFHKFMEEKKKIEKTYKDGVILLSREYFSGNLFTAYKDWHQNIKLIYKLFPEAKIIIFFRYQTDWLLSCYRESIYEHHYQKIGDFLDFSNVENDFNKNGFVKLYPYNLNYSIFIQSLYELYGEDNIYHFFFEDFKKFKKETISSLLSILDIDLNRIRFNDVKTIPNRGCSSFSIKLSLARYNFLSKKFIHRPIIFFGPGSIPAGSEELSCLDKEKYWNDLVFKRDNEEIRSVNYPKLSIAERIIMEFSWRHFIKHRVDMLMRFDKDLIYEYRVELDKTFKNINKDFKKIIGEVPKEYVE